MGRRVGLRVGDGVGRAARPSGYGWCAVDGAADSRLNDPGTDQSLAARVRAAFLADADRAAFGRAAAAAPPFSPALR